MSIAPFSFRDFGSIEGEIASQVQPKAFLPHTSGRKKEAAAPQPSPPPPPVFTEADIKNAERDGYQKGFLDGIEEGKQQMQSAQAEAQATLAQTATLFMTQLAPLFSTYREMLKLAGQQVPQLAQAIAKKVAGAALEEKAHMVIEEIAKRCLESMHHEPKLTIIVHESQAEILRSLIDAMPPAQKGDGEIIVHGDAHISPQNCRVEWKNGALVRDSEQLWQEVDKVIASMIASNERDADALADALQAQAEQSPPDHSQTAQGE